MGDDTTLEQPGISRRLRRAVVLSIAGLLPYVLFVTWLSISPETLGRHAEGSAISLGIYLAVFLFLWPVAIAVLYLRGLDEKVRST